MKKTIQAAGITLCIFGAGAGCVAAPPEITIVIILTLIMVGVTAAIRKML